MERAINAIISVIGNKSIESPWELRTKSQRFEYRNGNQLQYSWLENPMDGGAWKAAVHEVAKSQTRLKRLGSSSIESVNRYLLCNHVYGMWSGKEPACQCRRHKRHGFDPWVGKIPWRRKWQSTPALLTGKSHGWRSLIGYSPWGRKELDMTPLSLSLSCLFRWSMYFMIKTKVL